MWPAGGSDNSTILRQYVIFLLLYDTLTHALILCYAQILEAGITDDEFTELSREDLNELFPGNKMLKTRKKLHNFILTFKVSKKRKQKTMLFISCFLHSSNLLASHFVTFATLPLLPLC